MQFLITGIAGFIGSHTGEKLVSQGHQVVGIDNFDAFYPRSFKESNLDQLKKSVRFTFYEADIRNSGSVKDIFSKHQIDTVIHLAAKAGVRPSMEQIAEYYEVNINGTVNLLERMKEANVSKLIFASSSSVYGNNKKIPFSESDAVDHPISPYAATKKSGELLCHVYSNLYGLDITCLRFFTVFGPRQRPDLAIHKFTRLIDQGKPVPVFGDGSASRDYTYIEDIVSGILCAVNKPGGFRIYNIGESRVVTLKELIVFIEKALNKKAILDHFPSQAGDMQKTFADITKAREELGYNPGYNLETGLQHFIDWYRQNKEHLYN
jgi:UDP-glucuronate 4-epimerase